MNICFVHEEYPEETNFGGIATYQKNMAEELVKHGNIVYVICRGLLEDKVYSENGVKIYRLFVPTTNDQVYDYVRYRKRVASLLNDFQKNNLIDIIETPDWGAETIYFEQDRRVPLIVRLHTPLKVWLKYNKNNFGEITNLLLTWEETMLKSADLITCCSSALKNIIVEEFNISNSRILVTPNPANVVNFFRDNNIKKENKLVFVGSLEERKGVCVLAKSLNIIFEKFPDLKIEFIGKDTDRNSKNISTKDLILEIVNHAYWDNIIFVGQIPNKNLNSYLNSSRVGIYPSLFDNFPYVVLESMATGLHIVGSKNSGMVEMLADDSAIYNTGDYKDLADKIIQKYKISLEQEISKKNVNRIKTLYNPIKVCNEIITVYQSILNEYGLKHVSYYELQKVLSNVTNEKIISFNQEKGGVANLVFKVLTPKNKYIIKKYLYKYDFDLSNELYKKYKKANIKHLKPINNHLIHYNHSNYNVFKYLENEKHNINKNDLFEQLICCERNTNFEPTIKKKCEKYYTFLIGISNFDGIIPEEVNYVIKIFENLKDMPILNDKYLNHGDISKSNIITSNGNNYIIDFDETTVTTLLYDFAVIVIKNYVENNELNYELYYYLRENIKNNYPEYNYSDFNNIIKYYLCKILMEKFYFHSKKKINLFNSNQNNDNYMIYLKILKDMEKI